MLGSSKLKLRNLNEHLICAICGGYFVDATTIIECLHSFCRSCIVTHMMMNRCCPKCEVPAHKTRPLLNIRSDKTLQDIVYKLVPDLLEKEKARKIKFHEDTGIPMDDEDKKHDSVTLTPEKREHRISLSLEYDSRNVNLSDDSQWKRESLFFPKRYLRCYDAVSVSTVHKLVRSKLRRNDLEVLSFCRGEVLPENYTLRDVADIFSWKSDRPLSLTYMTFTTKARKRKILETIDNEMNESNEVPCKKPAIKPESIKPKQSVATLMKQLEKAPQQRDLQKPTTLPEAGSASLQSEARIINSTTSSQFTQWKPKPFVNNQQRQSNAQVNGIKNNLSYSVRNVPFVGAVSAPTSEVARHVPPKSPNNSRELGSNSPSQRTTINGATTQTQSQTPLISANPQGKAKSINSIANRLQMEKVRSAPEKSFSQAAVSTRESANVSNQPLSSKPANPRSQISNSGSSFLPSDVSARMKMKRNLMAQRVNASTFRSQNSNEESRSSRAYELLRQEIRPGISGSQGVPPSRDRHHAQSNASGQGHGSFIRIQVNSDPPNYSQATDQQNKIRLIQQRQAIRSKYPEIQPKLPTRVETQQTTSQPRQFPRRSSFANSEDSQLLSTTRQLASLREQQKLLNEIAAAVAARNANQQRGTESMRAAISGLSPKTSSTRITSSPRITSSTSGISKTSTPPTMRSIAPQPIRPSAPVNSGVIKVTNPTISNGNFVRAPGVNGTKSFNEVSRLPQNIGYPSLNNPREGSIDIYQNTIAKAKAQVREMSMKDRDKHQRRTQIRAAVSPYNVQSPNTVRKIRPAISGPSFVRNTMHQQLLPKPPPQVSPTHRSSPSSSYRGLNTRPPPPPQSRFVSPNSGSPRLLNRQYRPPPPPTTHAMHHRNQPEYKPPPPPITLPEQDQPLCLVVKK